MGATHFQQPGALRQHPHCAAAACCRSPWRSQKPLRQQLSQMLRAAAHASLTHSSTRVVQSWRMGGLQQQPHSAPATHALGTIRCQHCHRPALHAAAAAAVSPFGDLCCYSVDQISAGSRRLCGGGLPQHHWQRAAWPAAASAAAAPKSRRCGVAPAVAAARPPRMRGQTCDLSSRPRSTALPDVDWRRYHLNVLFVDRTDTVRARVAAGLFERISEWNGFGRILLTATAGVDARPETPPDMSTNMALFSQAGLLGIRPKGFAGPPERFEADDFYRYDTIVALDEDVRQRIVEMGFAENPSDSAWYTSKVCALGAFSYYCGDELLAHGGSALLEKELVRILLPVLHAARAQSDIPRPSLAAGAEEWNPMVAAVLVATAGLFKYLGDVYPPDLPEYDPV